MTDVFRAESKNPVDLGVIIDNTDTAIEYCQKFEDQDEAEAHLESCTAQVRAIETDACKITSVVSELDGGVQLQARYEFCCEAEKLIFEMRCKTCCV
ncbi:YfcZ/YiiS family protein [Parendozoicomonas sp. Alg238-R29]|uniref:YfcZ/YiiS family protein n=1 Tax=Parendozoicomonas sp. Alg238-R29 TaxID=2993446 RepID=UPI00248E3C3F|nr:YfcZ/YiiS family protein [Parendozoicomonas sp. Alg238-R29]